MAVRKKAKSSGAALARLRLRSQGIAGERFGSPEEVVRRLCAVQAQDYYGGLWAIGLRLQSGAQDAVEAALAHRAVVRTWPMRGTLHIVAAEDARWMLELMTPRVIRGAASRYRQLELDERVFANSARLVVKQLEGGRALARPAFYRVLEEGGISTAENRGLHILGHLAQMRLICFGVRAGKQQTLVLFDEWIASERQLSGEEALAELVRRYFIGHGPATIQDLGWWSGLPLSDLKRGLAAVQHELAQIVVDDRTYWLDPALEAPQGVAEAHLLPVYDEFTVGYRDRSAALDPARAGEVGNGIFSPTVVVKERIAGTWTRALHRERVVLALRTFEPLAPSARRQVDIAARRFGKFLGVACEVDWGATAPFRQESRPRTRG